MAVVARPLEGVVAADAAELDRPRRRADDAREGEAAQRARVGDGRVSVYWLWRSGSARDLGSRGRRFDPGQPDQMRCSPGVERPPVKREAGGSSPPTAATGRKASGEPSGCGCDTITVMYKDIEKQRASWRRYYRRNKSLFRARARAKKKALYIFVANLKTAPCLDCKRHYPPVVMDFDHVKGEKLARISQLAGDGMKAALIRELEKCELVCANCHRIRTQRRAVAVAQSEGHRNVIPATRV